MYLWDRSVDYLWCFDFRNLLRILIHCPAINNILSISYY
jgi:hypothetical protein